MSSLIEDLPDGTILKYRNKRYVKTYNKFDKTEVVLISRSGCYSGFRSCKNFGIIYKPPENKLNSQLAQELLDKLAALIVDKIELKTSKDIPRDKFGNYDTKGNF